MLSSSYKTTTKWTLSPAVCKVHECSVSHNTCSVPPQLEVYRSSTYVQIINMKPNKTMRPTGADTEQISKLTPCHHCYKTNDRGNTGCDVEAHSLKCSKRKFEHLQPHDNWANSIGRWRPWDTIKSLSGTAPVRLFSHPHQLRLRRDISC